MNRLLTTGLKITELGTTQTAGTSQFAVGALLASILVIFVCASALASAIRGYVRITAALGALLLGALRLVVAALIILFLLLAATFSGAERQHAAAPGTTVVNPTG